MSQVSIQTEELFQFLTVRPPETAEQDIGSAEDIASVAGATAVRGVDTNLLTEFAEMQQVGRDRATFGEKAREWFEEQTNDADGEGTDQLKKELTKAYDAVLDQSEQTDPSEVPSILTRLLGESPEAISRSEAFHTVREHLWNTLYALTALSDNTSPYRRERVVDQIRAAELIRLAAESSGAITKKSLNSLSKMTPVLPDRAFPIPKRTYESPEAEEPSTLAELHQRTRQTKQELIEQLIGLHRGVEEIRSTYTDYISNQANASEPQKTPDSAPSGEARRDDDLVSASTTSDRPSMRKFPEQAMESLTEQTRAILDKQNIRVAGRPIVDVLDDTRVHLQQLTDRLYRSDGEREVIALGKVLKTVGPKTIEDVQKLASMVVDIPGLSMLEEDPATLIEYFSPDSEPVLPLADSESGSEKERKEAARPLGIGELNRVEQKLLRYENGEVAHIENVLEGEHKLRKHRRLDKTEETYITETEKETETKKDLRTSERFEMSSEAEKTVESESSFEAGVTVTAKYGSVKMKADAGYSTRNAKSKSTKKSKDYAQEVTRKSLNRIQKRVKEKRETTTIREVEEINKHEFENESDENITGIYRWVDKIYEARVLNYDKRLMYEFIIPEPAAYYRYMQENEPLEGASMEKPKDIGQLKPSDIQPDNYQTWVQRYKVEDVSPPPPEFQFIGTVFTSKPKQNGSSTVEPQKSKEIEVPSGYKLKDVQVEGGYTFDRSARYSVEINIYVADNELTLMEGVEDKYDEMAGETGLIPVGVMPHRVNSYVLTLHLRCERTSTRLDEWRQETYSAIVKAYKAKKSKYEEQRRAAQSRQGVEITGRNPQRNREIEKEELKKHAISLLRRKRYQNQDAIGTDPTGAPTIEFDSADDVSRMVQFFEQAFEWEQMSYLFYPYFWGSRDSWEETFLLEDDDPQFTKFLRAGAARVVVPVRPDYEEAVLHYNETGETWNGEGIPAIDDDLYVSLVEELKAETGGAPEGSPVGEPWENRVPTELVRLQKDSSLPDLQEETDA